MNLYHLYRKFLDVYFKSPIIWDYSLGCVSVAICWWLQIKEHICLPKSDNLLSVTTDLSTVSLTIAGFILTFLTVLITFKSSSKVTADNYDAENDSLFEIFFASELYFQTVKYLKNCIKSLIFVAVIGYSLKLSLNEARYAYLLLFDVFALIIITLTMLRSLLILTKIIEMQK